MKKMLQKRGFLLIAGLLAAVGVPMALDTSEGGSPFSRVWQRLTGGHTPAANTLGVSPRGNLELPPPPGAAAAGTVAADGTMFAPAGPKLEGPAVYDPAEVFRFDISPGWVIQRWSRATTVTGEPALGGYRVPLVTGPNPHDLAGSLTYYFNAKQEVQRITFVGTTGDPAGLVALATRRFGFVAVPSPGPGVYTYQIRWRNRPRSELRLRTAEVIRADVPFQRFDVDLEINLPDVPPSRAMHGETAQRNLSYKTLRW